MIKTTHAFDWENGYQTRKRLSRSFETLADAEQFAKGKKNAEIYKSKGKFKVEWLKVIDNNQ